MRCSRSMVRAPKQMPKSFNAKNLYRLKKVEFCVWQLDGRNKQDNHTRPMQWVFCYSDMFIEVIRGVH